MGANYTHTTRGEITLTPEIYNADHQNHIDNQTPALFDDYSVSVAQMRSITDPGAVGSESLATDLAGELARLRYVIKTLHGGDQWYDYAETVARMQIVTDPGGVGTESLATSLVGELERLRYAIKALHGGAQWYALPAAPLGPTVTSDSALTGLIAVNIADIPAGVKRVTLNYFNVASNGIANIEFRLGTAAGIQFTSYNGSTTTDFQATRFVNNSGDGHVLITNSSSLVVYSGRIVATLMQAATNTWGITHMLGAHSSVKGTHYGTSIKALPGVLTQVGIRTANSIDTFASGTINVMYE